MDVITLGADHPHGLHFHVRTVTGAVVGAGAGAGV